MITGVGTANVTTALANFQTAIGGVSNNGKASPQTGGFRTINWDGVKVDGTDSGGPPNTTVIHTGDVVGIPLNRFQGQGVSFEEVYAVSNNGFATVNTNAAGLFPAFSTPNTFAMFNDNTIDMSFVLPSAVTSTPVPAATRGFGAVFIDAQIADTSSIEYFSGDRSLGKFSVPVSPTPGDPEFLGVLFGSPLVTRVHAGPGDRDAVHLRRPDDDRNDRQRRDAQPGRHRRLRLRRAGASREPPARGRQAPPERPTR